MLDSILGDGQCERSNGIWWRCKSPSLDGSCYCQKHHLQVIYHCESKPRVRVSQPSIERKKNLGSAFKKRKELDFIASKIKGKRVAAKRRKLSEILAKEGVGLASNVADPSAASVERKKSGRPSKSKNSVVTVNSSVAGSSVERKNRGTASKAKNLDGIEEKKEKEQSVVRPLEATEVEESESVGVSVDSVERKKRGRPLKSKNSEGTEVASVSAASVERKKRGRASKAKNSVGTEIVSVSAAPIERNKLCRPSRLKNSEGTENASVVAGPSIERKKRGEASNVKNLVSTETKRPAGRPSEKSRTVMRGAEDEAAPILELGQVWAFSKCADGIPRSYARIDRISPMRVSLLVPDLVTDEEKLLAEQGLTLACGLFKVSESITKEISAFAHRVRFEIDGERGSSFKIFPKEGELWAIYLKWDASKKRFDYQLVEVESDFDEEDGVVNVFALGQVEGRAGVYRRQEYAGFHLVRGFSRGFMSMFSHRVPASRTEEGGEMLWKLL